MESLKTLIERRNKHVHDARQLLEREDLTSQDKSKADELLDAAAELDKQIDERQKDDSRRDRLSQLTARQEEDAPRQIQPARPGERPPQRAAAEPQQVDLGRHRLQARPGSRQAALASSEYQRRFLAYLTGDYRDSDVEQLGLMVGDNSKGGYLAPSGMVDALVKFLDNNVFMRQLGTVLPPTTDKSVGVVSYDTDPNDATWTAEVPASDLSEDTAARFGKREMIPHLLTKLLKVSKKILRSSSMDVVSFLIGRLGYKFAITEEQAFLTGDGAQTPLGIFTASTNGITTSQDVTASSATAFAADDLINTLYDLKEAYIRSSTWLLSREAVKRARKLKDGNGQYLWQPGLAGQPGTLLDRPYVMSEYVPSTYTTGLYVAAVGDLSHYWIQDGQDLEVQRLDELFALRNQVGLVASKETDAMPVLAEAFRRLKLA